jgi:hypothetical protein
MLLTAKVHYILYVTWVKPQQLGVALISNSACGTPNLSKKKLLLA